MLKALQIGTVRGPLYPTDPAFFEGLATDTMEGRDGVRCTHR
jgi:hypothetical protein